MGAKLNFTLSILALVIAVAGLFFALRAFLFQPPPLTEKKVSSLIEERTKDYLTQGEIEKIIQEALSEVEVVPTEEGGE